jgi:hypothetical protein
MHIYTYMLIYMHIYTYMLIYMYIYIYAYICIYIRICQYIYIYIYIYTHTHTYIHTYAHTHTHKCIYKHTYIHTYTYTYVYVCVCVCVCVCVYIYDLIKSVLYIRHTRHLHTLLFHSPPFPVRDPPSQPLLILQIEYFVLFAFLQAAFEIAPQSGPVTEVHAQSAHSLLCVFVCVCNRACDSVCVRGRVRLVFVHVPKYVPFHISVSLEVRPGYPHSSPHLFLSLPPTHPPARYLVTIVYLSSLTFNPSISSSLLHTRCNKHTHSHINTTKNKDLREAPDLILSVLSAGFT